LKIFIHFFILKLDLYVIAVHLNIALNNHHIYNVSVSNNKLEGHRKFWDYKYCY